MCVFSWSLSPALSLSFGLLFMLCHRRQSHESEIEYNNLQYICDTAVYGSSDLTRQCIRNKEESCDILAHKKANQLHDIPFPLVLSLHQIMNKRLCVVKHCLSKNISWGVLWYFTKTGRITPLGAFPDAFSGHKMWEHLLTAPSTQHPAQYCLTSVIKWIPVCPTCQYAVHIFVAFATHKMSWLSTRAI
jgi:hypothetical protein